MDDGTDLLAWRACQLGLRIANGSAMPHATLLDYIQQLGEIADGETTLHNSAAEIVKGTNLLGRVMDSTNQVVLGDRELARTILRGCRAAADTSE